MVAVINSLDEQGSSASMGMYRLSGGQLVIGHWSLVTVIHGRFTDAGMLSTWFEEYATHVLVISTILRLQGSSQ